MSLCLLLFFFFLVCCCLIFKNKKTAEVLNNLFPSPFLVFSPWKMVGLILKESSVSRLAGRVQGGRKKKRKAQRVATRN